MATPKDSFILPTGNPLIDGVISGTGWDFGGFLHSLSYSFSLNDSPTGGEWSFALSDAAQRALQAWSDVANLSFFELGSGTVYNDSPADIALILTGNDLQSDGSGIIGLGVLPSPFFVDMLLLSMEESRFSYPRPEGDVALDNYFLGYNYLDPGGFGLWAMLHEIGHALGLKHPFEYWNMQPSFAALGIANLDSNLYTVMSYTDPNGQAVGSMLSSGNAATPMPLDILAIQRMYGANTAFHTGADTYELRFSSGVRTIWDAGGLDAFSVGETAGATIDLNEGAFSSIGNARVAIAYGVIIENATGNSGSDTLIGNAAANRLEGRGGNDTIDGGTGTDFAVFASRRSYYALTPWNTGYQLTDASGQEGMDTLTGIERLSFADSHLAFDTDGNAGQMYRLYKAAFARTPDLLGLGNWIANLDNGATTLEQAAATFAASQEFQNLYGSNTSNEAFVSLLYLNALGRKADATGLQNYVNALAAGTLTRAKVLAEFSESVENKNSVQKLTGNGILYATGDQAANQNLSLSGSSGADNLYGSVGKDTLTGAGGDDFLNGGADIDTAIYSGARADYTITRTATGLTVMGGTEGTDTLVNVERLQFSDGTQAFDTEGNAGQIYRLYQAAFDRSPDIGGMSNYLRAMDNGMTLSRIATDLMGSVEFTNKYGANTSNDAFVTLLYENALDRSPDEAGKANWIRELELGMTRENALIGFAESAENQAAVIGVIQEGIALV